METFQFSSESAELYIDRIHINAQSIHRARSIIKKDTLNVIFIKLSQKHSFVPLTFVPLRVRVDHSSLLICGVVVANNS